MFSDWDLRFCPSYTIATVDFIFEDREEYANISHHDIQLRHGITLEVFCDKLTFIYLVMPKFNKQDDELGTVFDMAPCLLQEP